ncbi:hypothetical protein [Prevotella jejuni]|uniref:hypothetical protein n=1 Tax=Prevotella jejuni TaxID=1177574 RepID=UPI00352FE92E
MTRTYDAYGNVISQKSRSFRQDGYDRRYAWNASGRLQNVIDGITGGRTTYAYDAVGSLMSARYEDGTDDYRMPDAVETSSAVVTAGTGSTARVAGFSVTGIMTISMTLRVTLS